MNKIKLLLVLLVLLGVSGIGTAWADRGHRGGRAHLGVMIGVPLGVPWYYPPTYYYPPYYPPLVVRPQPQPQVYIEQPQAPVAPVEPVASTPAYYWYYCAATQSYYPYVKDCEDGWQKVLPQPPGQP